MTTKEQYSALSARFVEIWEIKNLSANLPGYYRDRLVCCECVEDQPLLRALAQTRRVDVLFCVDVMIAPLWFVADYLAPEIEMEILQTRCNEETNFDSALGKVLNDGDWDPIERVIEAREVEILDAETLGIYISGTRLLSQETSKYVNRGVMMIRRHGAGQFIYSVEAARELGRLITPEIEARWPEWAFVRFLKAIMVEDPTAPFDVTNHLQKVARELWADARYKGRENLKALDAIWDEVEDLAEKICFD